MELTVTETGLIGIIGMVLGFALSCCRQIEQSRCTTVDCCGVKCNRVPLHDETIIKMEEQKINEGNKKENELASL